MFTDVGRPFVAVVLLATLAKADPPTIDHLQLLNSTELKITGKFDLSTTQIFSESPRLTITPPKEKDQFFAIANGTPGPHWIRLTDKEGTAAPKILFIPPHPILEEKEPNSSHIEHQLIGAFPITVMGKLAKRGDVDAFGVALQKDQWLKADLDAYQLDAPIDPLLRLTDTEGNQFAFVHDAPNSLDPVLHFQAPKAGTYVLLLSGFVYPPQARSYFHGSDDSVYQLHLSHCPPSKDADLTGVQPNNSKENATAMERIPFHTSGVVGKRLDQDWFQLKAKKDEAFVINLKAHVIGSLLDGWIEIQDHAGKVLASNDDRGGHLHPDPQLHWKAPVDGNYFLVLRDIRRQGGPSHFYELQVNRATPRFEATVGQHSWTIPKDKPLEITVPITRHHGHASPVTIQAVGLSESYACQPVTIEKDAKEAKLTITAKENAQGHIFKISAKSEVDEMTVYHALKGKYAEQGALFLNQLTTFWIQP